MTPTEQAARVLADVPRHYDANADRVILEADALAAIARHLAPGDDLVERIAEPHDPGDFVGDIYYGHPVKTTLGTHRWTGSEWVALPSEAEALAGLLADAREEAATLRDRMARMEGAIEWREQQRRDAFARRNLNAPEDPHVAVLCERYGYGAVMDAASRLWARKDSMGAFYIGGCIGIKPGDTEVRSRS